MESESESELQQKFQVEAARHHCILERNNSGAFKNPNGQFVRFGLGNVSKLHQDKIKSSDLIGGTEVIITPEMVGRKVLIFSAFEIKEPGWNPKRYNAREQAQANYLSWVKSRGGIASFINGLDQFQFIFESWKRG